VSKVDSWMPVYVADYLADTQHLTTAEHGAYLLLLLHAWRSGGKLPVDTERLRTITKMQPAAWRASWPTLKAFFDNSGSAFTQKRLSKELGKAANMNVQRSEAGKASAAARWGNKGDNGNGNENGNAKGNETVTGVITNAPRKNTPSQSSLQTSLQSSVPPPSPSPAQNTTARKRAAIRPANVAENVWNDFLQIRNAKHAPLNETALKGIVREAGKAGMSLEAALTMACERGWQGFESSWVKPNGKQVGHGNLAAAEEAGRQIFGQTERDITHDSKRI